MSPILSHFQLISKKLLIFQNPFTRLRINQNLRFDLNFCSIIIDFSDHMQRLTKAKHI